METYAPHLPSAARTAAGSESAIVQALVTSAFQMRILSSDALITKIAALDAASIRLAKKRIPARKS